MACKYSNSQIHIKADINNLRRYDQGFEIKVYNIVHEFINNILKHSKASKAELKMSEVEKKLFIFVKDNGKGFDIDQIPKKDGLGIHQIDARIKIMKGTFGIESSAGNGTKIEVVLPIRERKIATTARLAKTAL